MPTLMEQRSTCPVPAQILKGMGERTLSKFLSNMLGQSSLVLLGEFQYATCIFVCVYICINGMCMK